jgi:hypothetical protein
MRIPARPGVDEIAHDQVITWFWIGSHADYDNLIR